MFKNLFLLLFLMVSLQANDFNFKNISISSANSKGKFKSYNFMYTKDKLFLNGEISVEFKAISGDEDQGGGIMYRVIDDNNYYVARFNPLEDNFRIYYVKDGYRSMMKSAKIRLDSSKWHKMKIIQNQNHYEAYLDGKKLLSANDNTFVKAGGVGVWTKADAYTKFRNLEIK